MESAAHHGAAPAKPAAAHHHRHLIESLALIRRENGVEGLHRRQALLELGDALSLAVQPLRRGERPALGAGPARAARPGTLLRPGLLLGRDEGAECRLLVGFDLEQVVQALLAPMLHVRRPLLTIGARRSETSPRTLRPLSLRPSGSGRTILRGGGRGGQTQNKSAGEGDAMDGEGLQ